MSTELPWLIMGRLFRPVVLAVGLATVTIAYQLITRGVIGKSLDGVAGVIIGCTAMLASALLAASWFAKNERIMQMGLLFAAGVWAAVGTYLFLDSVMFINYALSLAWFTASAGSYLLEVSTPIPRRGEK